MNTKYPINGRVATLNDLVHEYGASSAWPKSTEYKFFDTSKIVSQPFQNLVFKDALDANNKFVGERPYEIVYFDNVYSNTERDTTGKHMKIIQKNDSDVFSGLYPGGMSGHEYIKAGDVANPEKIIEGKYGFKFIVASQNNKKQYYYNYRTSTGEATVMYALRNIIKILKKLNNNLLACIQYLLISEDDGTYPEIDNIIDKNNNELKSNAYKYLGDFIWTYKNIKIKNYTRTEQSILNIAESKGYLKLNNNSLISIKEVLTNWTGKDKDDNYSYNQESDYNQLKYYLNIFANSQRFFVSYVTGFRFGKISNKSYLQIEPVLRCDLGVLRIYESIIIISAIHDWQTALPAGKIKYETSINIILQYKIKYKNLQTYSSPITTTIGPISFNDIKKYREPTSTKITEDKKEETIENDIWYTLKTYVGEKNNQAPEIKYGEKYSEDVKYYDNTYKYGTTYFPALPSEDLDENNTAISKISYSLQDLRWPLNENLQLTSIDDVTNSMGNPKFISPVSNLKNYADTNNNKIFDGDAETVIKGGIAPFGILRIHSSLDLTAENIKASSYYIDTSIYRCKNYYYISNDNQSSENATVTAYFTPKYTDSTPYIKLPIHTINITDNIDDKKSVLDASFNDIIKNTGNYYSIPNKLNTLYFTVQSGTAKQIIYASGYKNTEENDDAIYNNNSKFTFYYLSTKDTGEWIEDKSNNITVNPTSGSTTVKQYEITFNFSSIYSKYWRFKLSDINQYFYFRCNYYNKNADNIKEVKIYSLFVTDNSLVQGMIEYQMGLRSQSANKTLSLKYAVFNTIYDTDEETTLDTGVKGDDFGSPKTLLSIQQNTVDSNTSAEAYVNTLQNIYIQPISIINFDKYKSDAFSSNNPFYAAWEYQNSNNQQKVYKFSNANIFTGEYKNSRVTIDKIYNHANANIYLSFEPIYIINSGEIKQSTDATADNLNGGYTNFFNTCKLVNIKLLNNGIEQTVNKTQNTATDGFINSIFSNDVYIDSTSICVYTGGGNSPTLDYILFDSKKGIINNYLFNFDIVFSIYDSKNNIFTEGSKINISNKIMSTNDLNNKMSNITFKPNTQTKVDIVFKKFKERLKHYTITIDSDFQQYNSTCQIKIVSLPDEYDEELIHENDTYRSNLQVPAGTTIDIKNTYDWSQDPNYELYNIIITINDIATTYGPSDTISLEKITNNIKIYLKLRTKANNNNNNTNENLGDVSIDFNTIDDEIVVTMKKLNNTNRNVVIKYTTLKKWTSISDTAPEPTYTSDTYTGPISCGKDTTAIKIAACTYNPSSGNFGTTAYKTCTKV